MFYFQITFLENNTRKIWSHNIIIDILLRGKIALLEHFGISWSWLHCLFPRCLNKRGKYPGIAFIFHKMKGALFSSWKLCGRVVFLRNFPKLKKNMRVFQSRGKKCGNYARKFQICQGMRAIAIFRGFAWKCELNHFSDQIKKWGLITTKMEKLCGKYAENAWKYGKCGNAVKYEYTRKRGEVQNTLPPPLNCIMYAV